MISLLSNIVHLKKNTYMLLIYIPIIYILYNDKLMNKIIINKNKIESKTKEKLRSERVFSEEERTFIKKNLEENIYMKRLNINIPISELSLIILKNAYKRESKLFHPDKGGDIETMKEVNLAYAKLKELLTK